MSNNESKCDDLTFVNVTGLNGDEALVRAYGSFVSGVRRAPQSGIVPFDLSNAFEGTVPSVPELDIVAPIISVKQRQESYPTQVMFITAGEKTQSYVRLQSLPSSLERMIRACVGYARHDKVMNDLHEREFRAALAKLYDEYAGSHQCNRIQSWGPIEVQHLPDGALPVCDGMPSLDLDEGDSESAEFEVSSSLTR